MMTSKMLMPTLIATVVVFALLLPVFTEVQEKQLVTMRTVSMQFTSTSWTTSVSMIVTETTATVRLDHDERITIISSEASPQTISRIRIEGSVRNSMNETVYDVRIRAILEEESRQETLIYLVSYSIPGRSGQKYLCELYPQASFRLEKAQVRFLEATFRPNPISGAETTEVVRSYTTTLTTQIIHQVLLPYKVTTTETERYTATSTLYRSLLGLPPTESIVLSFVILLLTGLFLAYRSRRENQLQKPILPPPPPAPAPVIVKYRSKTPAIRTGRYCPKCGRSVPEQALRCPHCGTIQ